MRTCKPARYGLSVVAAILATFLLSAAAQAETTKAQVEPYDEVVAACDAAADLDESCDYSTNDDGVLTGCFNGQKGPCFQCKPDGTRTCQIMRTRLFLGTVRKGFRTFGVDAGGSLSTSTSGSSAPASTTPPVVIIY